MITNYERLDTLIQIISPKYMYDLCNRNKQHYSHSHQHASLITVVENRRKHVIKNEKKEDSRTAEVYLTTFMVSSKNSNPLRITHFQGHQELDRLTNQYHHKYTMGHPKKAYTQQINELQLKGVTLHPKNGELKADNI